MTCLCRRDYCFLCYADGMTNSATNGCDATAEMTRTTCAADPFDAACLTDVTSDIYKQLRINECIAVAGDDGRSVNAFGSDADRCPLWLQNIARQIRLLIMCIAWLETPMTPRGSSLPTVAMVRMSLNVAM